VSGQDLIWLVSSAVAIAGFILTLIGLDRRTMSKIQDGDNKLHSRIDDVKDGYVRRDDLNSHVRHLEQTVDKMANEQRRTNERIDQILAAVIKEK